jgi:hypothetical protein
LTEQCREKLHRQSLGMPDILGDRNSNEDRASSSHPHHHQFWNALANAANGTQPSLADTTYAILLISALGLSVLILLASRLLSGDPIFTKETLKLPRFRVREYEALPTHVQNGNGIGHAEEMQETKTVEPLVGWRLRMGIAHTAVIAGLLAIHVVILISDGPTALRITFVVYWV